MTEDIVNVLKVAFEQHRAGNVQDAELGYRRVITKDAHQPDALHLLGVLSKNQDDVQGACDFLTRVHHDALAWTECVTAAGGGEFTSRPRKHRTLTSMRRNVQPTIWTDGHVSKHLFNLL
jgi:hypothetical protein